ALISQRGHSSRGDRDPLRHAADLDRLARRTGGGRDRYDRTKTPADVGGRGDVGGLPVRRDRDRGRLGVVAAELDRLAGRAGGGRRAGDLDWPARRVGGGGGRYDCLGETRIRVVDSGDIVGGLPVRRDRDHGRPVTAAERDRLARRVGGGRDRYDRCSPTGDA